MSPPRPARHRERGQAIPLIAICSTVLLGLTALAVDIGLETHDRRTLQNAADSAALAGAHHLNTAPVTQAERVAGVEDALEVLHTQLRWPLGGSGLTQYVQAAVSSSLGCSGSSSCSVAITAGGDTVTVATPPTSARTSGVNGDPAYLQVDVHQSGAAGLGGAVGMISGGAGAHAVAYHFAPDQPFGFALYADSYAQDSNYDQVFSGNIYAYRSVQPQSSGQSATCVQGGSVILGSPQAPQPLPSPDPAPGQPQQAVTRAPSLTFLGDCAQAGGGEVAQTAAEGCPGTVQGVNLNNTDSYVDDPAYPQTLPAGISAGTTRACVADPAIPPPDLPAPSLDRWAHTYDCSGNAGLQGGQYQPGIYTCGLTVDHPLAGGMYEIVHNPSLAYDVTISQALSGTCSGGDVTSYDVCLYGVTFYLEQGSGVGASMYVGSGGGLRVRLTPYAPAGSSNPGDGHYPIYAPSGVTASVVADKYRTLLSTQGTVFLPSGSVSTTENADIVIDGQAVVATWINQGGNHPSPRITYDSGTVAPQREILRLVE